MGERRPILRLEELGPRILPSFSSLLTPEPPHAPPSAATHQIMVPALAKHGQGTFTYEGDKHGEQLVVYRRLSGTADLAGLGRVEVRGEVHAIPFMYHGGVWGNLTFSNARGSVTIKLHSLGQSDRLAQQFAYTVVGGTGTYTHLSGHGSLDLTLTPAPMGEGPIPHGTFTISV